MSLIVVTPPEPIVSLDEARLQLGITDGDHDDFLDMLRREVCAEIEPPSSWLGVAFGRQTLEMRLPDTAWVYDCRNSGTAEIELRCPPLVSVTSVKYLDIDNVEQTLDPSVYRVIGGPVITVVDPLTIVVSAHPAKIVLATNQSWPSVYADQEAIRIRYEAGYELSDPKLLPARQAMRMLIGEAKGMARTDALLKSEQIPGLGAREWELSSSAKSIVQQRAESLLSRYRVWYLA